MTKALRTTLAVAIGLSGSIMLGTAALAQGTGTTAPPKNPDLGDVLPRASGLNAPAQPTSPSTACGEESATAPAGGVALTRPAVPCPPAVGSETGSTQGAGGTLTEPPPGTGPTHIPAPAGGGTTKP